MSYAKRSHVAVADPNGAILDCPPDTGCSVSESCLACFLPICRHDDRGWFTRWRIWHRDVARVVAPDGRLLRIEETGLTTSSYNRAVARVRAGEPKPQEVA